MTGEPLIPTVERGATTIDALFGPLPPSVSTGQVWLLEEDRLREVPIRLGVTDGTATELLRVLGGPDAADLDAGARLVTQVTTPDTRTTAGPGTSGSPLIPQFGRRRR